MSALGSLYIRLGEPEGPLCGCICEVGDWAADEIEKLRAENKAQLAELHAISVALGTDEGHSSVTHIEKLRKQRDHYKERSDILTSELERLSQQRDELMQALKDIIDPIAAMKRTLGPGYKLDGAMAVQMAESAYYLQSIAKSAIAKCKETSND